MTKAAVYIFVFLALGFTACDATGIYNETRETENEVWAYESPLRFDVNVEDTVNLHDVVVNLRTSKTYEYSNLWLFVEFNYPTGHSYTDTIECPLAYPDGRWVGSSGPGYINTAVIIKKDLIFPVSGEYNINIRHGMRDDSLNEIKTVGLRIQRAV